ncbi:hypothetical protein Gotri_016404 [Gossypium trilobum]|uniref:Uncharacterized protein n=1 Tax=Gossypium trilobum TaxID=34281 RepID=A0A7J9E3L8_9ROSI|nr:hypothetical protein [Gossypium trilobum]
MHNHNQSGCSEELLTGSSQEPYNRKLVRANNRMLFRAVVCLQHMQDHNQFGNPLSIEFHLFKRDLILVRHCRICDHIYTWKLYKSHTLIFNLKHLNIQFSYTNLP